MEYYFINEIKELKDKINCYDKEIRNLNCKIDKVVDSLAWWYLLGSWGVGLVENF